MDNNNANLKFLAPEEIEWKELTISIQEEADPDTAKTKKAKVINAKRVMNEMLLSSLQMQNLMVVCGSGTSLGPIVQGPSMTDLWDAVKTVTTSDGRKIDRDYIANIVGYNTDKIKPNIEHFLSRCEAYIQVNNDESVSEYCSLCKRQITERCSFIPNEGQLIGHTIFLHRLSRRRVRDSRLKLFTTNYDLCFEVAAGLQGIVVIDGFSFSQPRFYDPRFFNYDIVRRPRTGEDLGNYLEGVIHLYKLHGSVNWARSNDGKSITIKEKPLPDQTCIIYPAQGKYQQSYVQPHLELIAQYLQSLREPNTCLIVTGFGFNDNHLAEPILSAVKTNPHLRLIIADCSAEAFCNDEENENSYWKELFNLGQRGEDIWFINASFQDFAQLIPDLKSLTPAEKLAKEIRSISKVML